MAGLNSKFTKLFQLNFKNSYLQKLRLTELQCYTVNRWYYTQLTM